MTNFRPLYIFLAALAVITAYVVYDAKYNYVNWRTANRSSAGIAPSPLKEKEAVVQVYAARTYNWRGYFAVHPWIAVKKKTKTSIPFIRLPPGTSTAERAPFPLRGTFPTATGTANGRSFCRH